MNKIVLIGNLTRDPELSTTTSGIAVCKFSIAVPRPFANQGGEKVVDYFNIVAWRGLAENCSKYLSKGKKAAVSGRLELRSYEDKDGNKRTATEIIADDVEFLSPKSADGQDEPQASKTKSSGSSFRKACLEPVDDADDLPF